MPRIARIVVPGFAHHVTQRGNRRERVFFEPADYRFYKLLLAEAAAKTATEVWAYCLMPNHVHLLLVPQSRNGLSATLGEAHRQYTRYINDRHGWTGHLWQGRFGSAAMDEDHLANAVRYISLNPVRAKLVTCAADWPWSSVRAHLAAVDDQLVKVRPILDRFPRLADMLDVEPTGQEMNALRKSETSGQPLGSKQWIESLGAASFKRGRKPRNE